MSKNTYFIYLLTNQHHNVLYTGVTNDLKRRIYEHREKLIAGFSQKYNANQLVYFEGYSDVRQAIEREKQIKSWSRKRKNELISSTNPNWQDLYADICQ